jgi:KaiC/GvpD/RAD55 family RecA-like ATPase
MRKLLENRERELDHREKEISERENELLGSLEEMEKDTEALDRMMANVEKEETMLAEKERALRDRENELQRISDSLSAWREVINQYEELKEGGEVTPQDIERVIKIQEDFQEVLERERERLRTEVREELEDELDAIAQREKQFRITESALRQKATDLRDSLRDRKPLEVRPQPMEEVDMEALKEDLFRELDAQRSIAPELLEERTSIRTHIDKLDSMLDGGIPRGHVVLVSGTTGAMKSSLSYHILHHSAMEGIRGMYFSLEQSRESIIRQMIRLGMDRERSRDNLMVVDMVDLRKAMLDEEGDWRTILTRYVQNVKSEKEFDLFVLDSLESFKAMSEYSFSREDLAELFDWFREMGLTTLLISELPKEEMLESNQGELYLADGAIQLTVHEVADRMQRRIKIPKMRGMNVDQKAYTFRHERGTFQLHSAMTSPFG